MNKNKSKLVDTLNYGGGAVTILGVVTGDSTMAISGMAIASVASIIEFSKEQKKGDIANG